MTFLLVECYHQKLPYMAKQHMHLEMRTQVRPMALPCTREHGLLSLPLLSGSLSLRSTRESSACLTWSV